MVKVIHIDEDIEEYDAIIALGEFDGIHLGHQELLNVTKSISLKHGYKSAMLTFTPHPDYVIGKREYEGYLTPLKEKERIVNKLGIDYLFVLDFMSVSSMSPEEFYDKYLSKFKGVVCGFDFKFGYKGSGNASFLKDKFDICEIVNEVLYYGVKVGSSEIRRYLSLGNIKVANEFLDRRYSLDVKVINVDCGKCECSIDKECYLPKNGIYKCEYFINEYESCLTSCIIEKMVLKLNEFNNIKIDDIIRIELIEYIESGV